MIRKTLVINGVTRNLVLDKDETLATVSEKRLSSTALPGTWSWTRTRLWRPSCVSTCC